MDMEPAALNADDAHQRGGEPGQRALLILKLQQEAFAIREDGRTVH